MIAHRGASAYRPEHTLSAYRLGVDGLFADNADTAVAVRRRLSR